MTLVMLVFSTQLCIRYSPLLPLSPSLWYFWFSSSLSVPLRRYDILRSVHKFLSLNVEDTTALCRSQLYFPIQGLWILLLVTPHLLLNTFSFNEACSYGENPQSLRSAAPTNVHHLPKPIFYFLIVPLYTYFQNLAAIPAIFLNHVNMFLLFARSRLVFFAASIQNYISKSDSWRWVFIDGICLMLYFFYFMVEV
jgi:hypothetical protein